MNLIHKTLTDRIIKAYYNVYNYLGYGFLEKVYENAMAIELKKAGISFRQQYPIIVYYNEEIAGEYFADLVVDDKVIVELKALENIQPIHEIQLINYLKATKKEVGLVFNFGKKPEFKRKILSKI